MELFLVRSHIGRIAVENLANHVNAGSLGEAGPEGRLDVFRAVDPKSVAVMW